MGPPACLIQYMGHAYNLKKCLSRIQIYLGTLYFIWQPYDTSMFYNHQLI